MSSVFVLFYLFPLERMKGQIGFVRLTPNIQMMWFFFGGDGGLQFSNGVLMLYAMVVVATSKVKKELDNNLVCIWLLVNYMNPNYGREK